MKLEEKISNNNIKSIDGLLEHFKENGISEIYINSLKSLLNTANKWGVDFEEVAECGTNEDLEDIGYWIEQTMVELRNVISLEAENKGYPELAKQVYQTKIIPDPSSPEFKSPLDNHDLSGAAKNKEEFFGSLASHI